MLKHRIVSGLLVLVISVLCPAACGLCGAAEEKSASSPGCCSKHATEQEGSGDGDVPANPPTVEDCFCSTHGVTLSKASDLLLPVLPFPIAIDAPDEGAPSVRIAFCELSFSGSPPPDRERVLPLLI